MPVGKNAGNYLYPRYELDVTTSWWSGRGEIDYHKLTASEIDYVSCGNTDAGIRFDAESLKSKEHLVFYGKRHTVYHWTCQMRVRK